jgi:integrase
MSRQTKGLNFTDRIAPLPGGGFVFRCQRVRHPEVNEECQLKRDAQDLRTNHDHEFHTGKRQSAASQKNTKTTLDAACAKFLGYYEELEEASKKDPQTLRYYRQIIGNLLNGLGGHRLLLSVTDDVVRSYILWRFKTGTTAGSRIVKELKALQKIAAFNRVPLEWSWKDFLVDIQPAVLEKRVHSRKVVMMFIERLDKDAQDYALAQLRTVLRGVELRGLRVRDRDRANKVLHFIKRSKRKKAPAIQRIADDLMVVLDRRCKGKLPDAFIFTCRGRQLKQGTFRKQCLNASKKMPGWWDAKKRRWAKDESGNQIVPIQSLGFVRHHALTAIRAALGIDDAATFAGHGSGQMIERHYDLDPDKLEAKDRAVAANVKAFPMFAREQTRPQLSAE